MVLRPPRELLRVVLRLKFGLAAQAWGAYGWSCGPRWGCLQVLRAEAWQKEDGARCLAEVEALRLLHCPSSSQPSGSLRRRSLRLPLAPSGSLRLPSAPFPPFCSGPIPPPSGPHLALAALFGPHPAPSGPLRPPRTRLPPAPPGSSDALWLGARPCARVAQPGGGAGARELQKARRLRPSLPSWSCRRGCGCGRCPHAFWTSVLPSILLPSLPL